MKPYPLDVKESWASDDGNILYYYSKGHHEPAGFLAAIKYEYDKLPKGATQEAVYQKWQRCVPVRDEYDFSYCSFMFVTAKAGARGAFPVTILDRFQP